MTPSGAEDAHKIDNYLMQIHMVYDEHICKEIQHLDCLLYISQSPEVQMVISQQICGTDGVTYSNQ